MVFVQICIGSSCHLKGSHEIVEKMQDKITKNGLEDEITLSGSFCVGKCNREGVTVQVDDDVFVGVTSEEFESFYNENILSRINK